MRILYLTDPGLDYLADQLYTGLCKLLGYERIVDFPWKSAYHDPACKAWYLPQNPARRVEIEEILAGLGRNEFDLVVLSAPRPGAVQALHALAERCKLPPLVLVDGEDDGQLRRELYRKFRFGLYFKREYRWHQESGIQGRWERWRQVGLDRDLFHRTYPLPFSAILETMPSFGGLETDLDISYVGRASHRKRVKAVRILKATRDIRFEGWVYAEPTDRRSKLASSLIGSLLAKCQGDPCVAEADRGRKLLSAEYYWLLGRSRMALSIRGGGFDTVRYWEIVASRRLLISERPDISIPFNFEHQKHAVFCHPDLSDLKELVRAYARDDVARATIAANGYAHLLKYHTCERRAEYFLNNCRRLL